jgi:hypothetical protein
MIGALKPYDNFMHHTFATFVMSMVSLVVVSLFTRRKPDEELKGVIWTRSALGLREDEKAQNKGPRNLAFWWALMTILIISLVVITHLQGSGVLLAEAEDIPFHTSGEALAAKQARAELAKTEKFNLWTGTGQILLKPAKAGEELAFDIPVPKSGRYCLVAMLTAGTGYGRLAGYVDGKPATFTTTEFVFNEAESRGRITKVTSGTFDASSLKRSSTKNPEYSIAGEHVVRRVSLGEVQLAKPVAHVSFRSEDGGYIGVDQFILEPLPASDSSRDVQP